MKLKLDLFEDFHAHGASAPEWNQRYLQISAGAMRSTLAEATADSIHVFRKWTSERVVFGEPPSRTVRGGAGRVAIATVSDAGRPS